MKIVRLSELNTMYHITYCGSLNREWFAEELKDGINYGFLLHIGSGFVKLTMAVIADSPEDAMDSAENWLREHKPEELVDGELPEEIFIERILA